MHLKHDNTIILVTGGPGTGKSYASKQILEQIEDLSLLSYDKIKEIEWDRFGYDNAAQKDRLNWFSLEEFYLTLQKMMWEGKTILTEYPFYQRHRDKLAELIEAYHYRAITVLLYGDWEVIYRRGIDRDKSQDEKRHPGHLTNFYHIENGVAPEDIIPDSMLTYEEFRENIDKKNYDVQLGETIYIDVTDFTKVDYEKVFKRIEEIDAKE